MKATALGITASFTMVAIVSQFYRSAVAVVAPDLANELALSPEALGVIGGGFFIGIASMQIPVGVLLDRFGPRRTTPTLLILAVAGATLFGLSNGFWGLLIGQTLIGMGCAGVIMGTMVAVARWFPQNRFAMVAAFVMGIGSIGLLLSATPLAWVADRIGWRNAFLSMAAITVICALIVAAVARDAPPGHDFHRHRPVALRDVVAGLREILGHRDLPNLLMLSFVAYGSIFSVRGLWGGPYLADVYGLDSVARGNVLLFLSLGSVAGLFVYGPIDSLLGLRKVIVTAGASLCIAIFAGLALVPGLPLTAITVLFAILGFGGAYAVLLIAHGRSLFEDRLVGRAMTMVNFSNFIGVGAMQIVSGLIVGAFPAVDGHPPPTAYRMVFAFLAAVLLVATIFYSRIRDRD
jgi:MFS family permease